MAEKRGFGFCWATHDLFKRSCFPILTSVATETSQIKVGSAIINPYTLNPAEIAMFAATLNELAPGRIVLGLSAGALKFFGWIGMKPGAPVQTTREATLLIRRLLGGERAEYEGSEFQWSNQAYMRFSLPSQNIPIYIGGEGPAMLELAGEIADGALPILFPPTFAKTAIERIRKGAVKAGRNFADIDIAGCVWFSISADSSIAENAIRRLATYYGPHLGQDVLSSIGLTESDFHEAETLLRRDRIEAAAKKIDDRVLKLAIVGTPSQCIEQIAELKEAGVTHLNIGPPLGPDPEAAVELIGKHVIPYFADD